MSPPPPLGSEFFFRLTRNLEDAIASKKPVLVTGKSPWPVSVDPAAWTPAGLSALVPDLGPVRIGNRSSSPSGVHEFWNVDMALAAAEEANPSGFRLLRLNNNETSAATMPMSRFWESGSAERSDGAVHYYSGSLLEEDGRASLPDLQRGLDRLIAAVGQQTPASRRFLKIWLGTDGASTPLHYDTQHNVYAQLHGSKDFWILPIYAARQGDVHLWPRIHPLSHFVRDARTGFGIPQGPVAECYGHVGRDFSGRCMLYVRLEAGDVLYLPPFWLHRTVCVGSTAASTTTVTSTTTASSASGCASTNVWVPSRAMQRMEDVEAMPLPFESDWRLPTRLSAVLRFLEAVLRCVHAEETGEEALWKRRIEASPPPPGGYPWSPPHALTPTETVERLLSTRWHMADEELLRPVEPEGRPSTVQQAAEAVECTGGAGGAGGSDWSLVNLTKLDEYARRRAAAFAAPDAFGDFAPERSWRAPKLILLHDQLERICHWATDGDARATLALLRRLRHCCEQHEGEAEPSEVGASAAGSDEPPQLRPRAEVGGHDEL